MPITRLFDLLGSIRFFLLCARMYWSDSLVVYQATRTRCGVPDAVLIFARGREAWQVSEFATRFFAEVRSFPHD